MGIRPWPALWLAASATALGVAGCGGGSSNDDGPASKADPATDPAALARRAFGPNAAAATGRIDGGVTITVRGVRGFGEPVTTSISGSYRHRKGSSLPDYAIDMGVRDRGVTLTSLRGRSYLSLGTTGYEIPGTVRRRLVRSAAKGRNGLTRTLEQFGVAPWRWEIDKRFARTERIAGVQTAKVQTGVNVGRVLRDANTLAGLLGALGLARANGLPSEIPPDARRVLVRSVTAAQGASWIGLADGVMRRAAMTVDFRIPKDKRSQVGGISSVKVAGRVDITQVGMRQTIDAPTSLAPFSTLQDAFDALADDAAG